MIGETFKSTDGMNHSGFLFKTSVKKKRITSVTEILAFSLLMSNACFKYFQGLSFWREFQRQLMEGYKKGRICCFKPKLFSKGGEFYFSKNLK